MAEKKKRTRTDEEKAISWARKAWDKATQVGMGAWAGIKEMEKSMSRAGSGKSKTSYPGKTIAKAVKKGYQKEKAADIKAYRHGGGILEQHD